MCLVCIMVTINIQTEDTAPITKINHSLYVFKLKNFSVAFYERFIPLTTDDAFWCCQILATCYQLAQSVLKIGSVLAESVGQGSKTGGGGWVHRSA